MSEQLQKILDFEKKLDHFQKELNDMNQQVKRLKDEILRNEIVEESKAFVVDDMPQEQVRQQEIPHDETVQKETRLQWQNVSVEKTPQNDLEKTIGKSLMGIFASVLVFISLILFATAILPHFTDAAKMFTTYVVSFGFLGIGLYKWRKNQENKFYIALTACGVGALYISLLLSNMYFDVIDDIPLYVLITLWGLGVCALCRIQTTLFQTIGHIGILISVAFGCLLCFMSDDTMKFTVLLVYYFVAMIMFFAVSPKRNLTKNIIFHVFNALNCLILVPSAHGLLGNDTPLALGLLLVFLTVNIGVLLWSETDAQGVGFAIFGIIYLVLFWVVLGQLLAAVPEASRGVSMYLVAMILLFLIEAKNFEKNGGKYATQACLLIMATNALGCNSFCEEYLYVPLLVIPMVLLGYMRKNQFGKYISLLLLLIYVFAGVEHCVAHFWLAIGAVLFIYAFMYIKKDQYQRLHKCFLHTLTIIVIAVLFSSMIDEWVFLLTESYGADGAVASATYLLIVVFHLIMMKTSLGNDLKTGERENPAYYNFVNMILMIVGVAFISSVENECWHLIVILLTLAVFMVNAKNLLDQRESIGAGIYVGIKFTILMIVIMNSFEVVNYVISISCFLLAIVAIVIGFSFEYKALRLFGLILSMISTFKLIMVDISYDNTLGNALSFFASGILCFVISLIYSQIDGKIGEGRK